MALNTVPFVAASGTIKFEDASGSPIVHTVQFEDGDGSISGLTEGQYNTEIFRDRGVMYSFRQIDEQEASFSMSAHATEVHDSTESCFLDCMLKLGAFSSGVSTLANNGDAWALKLTVTLDSSSGGTGGEAGQTFVFDYFIPEDCGFSEGSPGKFTVSGKCVLLASAGITLT